MISRQVLQLKDAEMMAERIMASAATDEGDPIVVVICDDRGDLMLLKRMDGAPLRSLRLAQNKAYTSALACVDTVTLAVNMKAMDRDLAAYGDIRFTNIQGGIVLRTAAGTVLGAIGISGRSMEDDHRLAEIGRLALESADC